MLPPQITTMHFNIIRSGHTNGRLLLHYYHCNTWLVLSFTRHEATIGYLSSCRALHPRLHDLSARACFTLTRNIRLNVFQGRGTGIPPQGGLDVALRTRRDSDSPTMMDKSFIGPAGRRDYVCSSRALRFPLKKFRRFSAATFWPFVSFAFFLLFLS